MVVRNSSGVRQAVSNFPNPITFQVDGAPLWLNVDPASSSRSGSAAKSGRRRRRRRRATRASCRSCSAHRTAINIAGVDGTLGAQGWLGNNQASRIEFAGTWGANANMLDVLTNDVNGVSLEGSARTLRVRAAARSRVHAVRPLGRVSEFLVTLLTVLGCIISSAADYISTGNAFRGSAAAAVAYIVSRGLAKYETRGTGGNPAP
jgi:hypothetical protein